MTKTIEQLKQETVELVEKYFPKGECKERGKASLLHGEMWVLFTQQLKEVSEESERELRKTLIAEVEKLRKTSEKFVPFQKIHYQSAIDDVLAIINKTTHHEQ